MRIKELLKKIGALAAAHNFRVYAVGGIVRDFLLKVETLDIDITVEGDGIGFGKIVKKELGGKLQAHPEFGTAAIILENIRIDIASCRAEEYVGPAKLPQVKTATLIEDLKRRDFTVNAMAMRLGDKDEEIIDPFGGLNDLKAKIIKVLHTKSFIDDPTRIFRGLRFAGRLGFKFDTDTESLLREAVKERLIEKLSPKRIREETIPILEEPKNEEIIKLMAQYDILKVLNLKLPEPNLFKAIAQNLHKAKGISNWFVYLLAILGLKNPSRFLDLSNKELNKISRVNKILKNSEALMEVEKPSEIYGILEHSTDEELIFLMSAFPKAKSKIMDFLHKYKYIKLEISGHNLKQLGLQEGPLYKELLAKTLNAKLDGEIKSKAEELKFVKKILSKDN